MADAPRTACAGRERARQDAARPVARRHSDLPARPAALCQPGISRTHRLCQPSRARTGRRPRCALRRARRLQCEQQFRHRYTRDDFRSPGFVGGELRASHRGDPPCDQLGPGDRARPDFLRHSPAGKPRPRIEPSIARVGAVHRRPRQRRGTRRHPRYGCRRHCDVRCRGQPQFVQPQRRSAVRL